MGIYSQTLGDFSLETAVDSQTAQVGFTANSERFAIRGAVRKASGICIKTVGIYVELSEFPQFPKLLG